MTLLLSLLLLESVPYSSKQVFAARVVDSRSVKADQFRIKQTKRVIAHQNHRALKVKQRVKNFSLKLAMITTTQIPFRFFHASTAAAAQRTTRTSSSSSTITTTTRANSIGQSGKKNKCGGQQKHVSSKAMDENENERGNVAMSARELKRALDEMVTQNSPHALAFFFSYFYSHRSVVLVVLGSRAWSIRVCIGYENKPWWSV